MNARECGNKEDFKQNGGHICCRIIIMNFKDILSCASVDNHIPRDDIFDYQPRRECNNYILLITNIYIFTTRNNMLKLSLAHVHVVSAFENTLSFHSEVYSVRYLDFAIS